MLNKTFPTRHRLIVKRTQGTALDGKPFSGRWGAALEALGMSLAGTVLFADHILLTEGDSDPILIQAVLQKLISLGKANIDLNAFSAISTENSEHTHAIISVLAEANRKPNMLVLVDGDKGGKERLKAIQPLLERLSIPSRQLAADTSIEDYLLLPSDLYVQAVTNYVLKLAADFGKDVDQNAVTQSLRESFDEKFPEPGKVTSGTAAWATSAGRKAIGLDRDPSKVGIAREYVALLEGHADPKMGKLSRISSLMKWIQDDLKIPPIQNAVPVILGDDPAE